MKRQKLKEFLSYFSLLVEIEIRTEKNLIEAEYIGKDGMSERLLFSCAMQNNKVQQQNQNHGNESAY